MKLNHKYADAVWVCLRQASYLLLPLMLIGLISCVSREGRRVPNMELSNDDLSWEINIAGLDVRLSPSAQAFLAAGELTTKQTQQLLRMLNDPSRFAVAHVLLTKRLSREGYRASASQWNGLHVKLLADGSGEYDAGQCHTLRKYWTLRIRDSNPS